MLKCINLIVSFLLLINNYKKSRLLSSSSMWIFCYALILVIYPLLSDDFFSNEQLIDEMTFVGLFSFFFGSYLAERIGLKISVVENGNKQRLPDFKISLYCFIITSLISIIFLYLQFGVSNIQQVIYGNLTSKRLILDGEGFSFALSLMLPIPFILCQWIVADGKKERIISLISLCLYSLETLIFGFTRIFLVSSIVVLFIHGMRHKSKKYQLIISLIMVILVFLCMFLMNFIRNFGISFDYELLIFYFQKNPLEGADFGASYYWFNALLNYDDIYINPLVYLKPFFAWIPRSVWESKPEPLSLQILKSIDPGLAATGYSTAGNSCLGEGYAVLGIVGIFVYPFIWGIVCTKMDRKYQKVLVGKMQNNIGILWYYFFTVFIIISCHRGDWSQYMTIVLWFFLLPAYLASLLNSKRKNE